MTRPRGVPPAGRRVVALGGGHGLAASLQALRRVTDDLTAVVVVSDDGGSSGRLRRELGVVPPGDLRMALAALCGDDTAGRTWARVVQHRFQGDGELTGHAVGNLLITALWEVTGDVVGGLDWVASLLDAHGRVLPLAEHPLEIVAEVRGHDAARPDAVTEVRGQVAVATSSGEVLRIRLEPSGIPACPAALTAVADAEVVVLGPGSWFTSVLPHLALPDMRDALQATAARRVLVTNLGPSQETYGLHPVEMLSRLDDLAPGFRLDDVLADPYVADARLAAACRERGAGLTVAAIAGTPDADGVVHRHDVDLLAAALGPLVRGRG